MPEEKLTEDEAIGEEGPDYQEKLAQVKAELEEKKLAAQMEMANQPAKEESPDPEQIFSPAQIGFLRAEIMKAWSAVRVGLQKRERDDSELKERTAPLESDALSMASQILGLLRVAEERLNPVLIPSSDVEPPQGGEYLMDVLGYARSYLQGLIDRIQV